MASYRTWIAGMALLLHPLLPVAQDTPLCVAVYDAPPFGFAVHDSLYGGLMVELWEDIAEELDYGYTYQLTDMESLLNGLQSGRFDVGLGAISITPNREAMVDFTQPVNPSGTGIAVAAGSWQSNFQAYWKPLIQSIFRVLGAIVLMLLLSGSLVWWVERHQHPDPSDRHIRNLADGLWWAAVTMTTVGYGDKVPHTRLGKAIGIVWIFLGILLFSLFTANASAILTTKRMESHIDSPEDLKRHVVGAVANSSGAEYLDRERIPYLPFETMEEALDALLARQVDAVVNNVPVLKYYNNHPPYFRKLAISQRLLLKNNMGVALPNDSSLREPVDCVLLQKISEPKWQQAVYRYLGEE
jgi:ABC-type amino acid transport substrate-binding protein